MKTIIYIALLFISLGIPSISLANWYGDHSYHISWNGGWCPTDSSPDVVGPTPQLYGPNYGSDGWSRYYVQARVNGWWYGYNNGWMRCQYWDSTRPTANNLTYAPSSTNGWQNTTNIVLNWTVNDIGGSGYQNVDIRVYRSNSQSIPTTLLTTLSNVASGLSSFNFSGQDGYAYKFEICPRDRAGNTCTSWTTSSDVVRIDMTPPNSANLTGPAQTNYLANNSQAFTFNFSDAGAPVAIRSQIENFSDPSTWITVFNPSSFAYSHTSNQNISVVDGADRGTNGGRIYTYRVTQICDQAGNCWNGTRDFAYTIYANPNGTVNNTGSISGAGIADGTFNTFTHTIADSYGNAIIPATGINRTVTQNLSGISNTMYLNQFARSGPTSVFVNNNTTSLQTSGIQTIGGRSSITGVYPLNLYVYTPTANSYTSTEPVSDPNAAFGFTSNLVVTDTLGVNRTFSQPLSAPRFGPLYTTSITGDLRNGGFIEGTIQSSSIVIQNNNPGVTPASFTIQGSFSGSDASSFNFYMAPPGIWRTSPTLATIQNSATNIPAFQSRLLQTAGAVVSNLSNLQFSTHFSYQLDGKNIIYNSDIIGKSSYHGYSSNIGSQYGVHIIGNIASSVARELTAGQFASSASIFGGISRADIRNSMYKSIALATRNITLNTVGQSIASLSSLPGGSGRQGGVINVGSDTSIMKLQGNGGFFTLSAGGISGKRTLVIEGADLYIDRDMYYINPSSILGVIVKKNTAGQGGNLYISPTITNIVGSYVIDGSVMTSTDGSNSTGIGDIQTLKNQLLIYGSIVSENTIGGSKTTPAKCPSLLNIAVCSMDEAQKYDLNYLRRYYLYTGNPLAGAKIIGGAICSGGSCTGFDGNLRSKFTIPTSELAKYPVIIEQNPLIRTSPPPGFDTTID